MKQMHKYLNKYIIPNPYRYWERERVVRKGRAYEKKNQA